MQLLRLVQDISRGLNCGLQFTNQDNEPAFHGNQAYHYDKLVNIICFERTVRNQLKPYKYWWIEYIFTS